MKKLKQKTQREEKAERLKEFLEYSDLDGQLRWIKRPSRRVQIGDLAGCTSAHGYVVIRFCGILFYAHHIVFFIKTGKWQSYIDHKDGNKTNNKIENLRPATHKENMRNTKPRIGCTSAYKGVAWSDAANKWRAYIGLDGRQEYLGVFENEAEAAEVYNAAATKYHGTFAKLNIIKE